MESQISTLVDEFGRKETLDCKLRMARRVTASWE